MSANPPAPGPPEGLTTAGSSAGAVARLVAVVLAGAVLAVLLHGVGVLVVVLAIVAMVMLHELGHFATAKLSRMKVTEYFFGFGPRLWSIRRGETDYGVKAIPAGGYVRIVGMTMLEEVDSADEARSYRQATFPRRVLVASAGSIVHMIIALCLCWGLFTFIGSTVPTTPYVVSLLRFTRGESPAKLAGLRPGDRFVSIDGHPARSFSVLEHEIGSHTGKTIPVVVDRHGRLLHLTVRPVDDKSVREYYDGQLVSSAGAPKGVIGITMSSGTLRRVDPLVAVPRSFSELGSLFALTWQGLTEIFSFHGLSQFAHSVVTAGSHPSASSSSTSSSASSSSGSQTQVMSILGVIELGSQAAKESIGDLLLLLAEVNVFIGLLNMLPMLPFDGGHVAIAVYERIRSRRGRRYHADVMKLMPFAYVFLAFIVVLGLGALYANIVQPVHLPGG